MALAVCLQPWASISVGAGVTLVQDTADWLDLPGGRDYVVYLELAYIADQASTTSIQVQTAPCRDEELFDALADTTDGLPYVASFSFSSSPLIGVQPLKVIRWADLVSPASSLQPPSRYFRWSITTSSLSAAPTFRIWLSVNQAGW